MDKTNEIITTFRLYTDTYSYNYTVYTTESSLYYIMRIFIPKFRDCWYELQTNLLLNKFDNVNIKYSQKNIQRIIKKGLTEDEYYKLNVYQQADFNHKLNKKFNKEVFLEWYDNLDESLKIRFKNKNVQTLNTLKHELTTLQNFYNYESSCEAQEKLKSYKSHSKDVIYAIKYVKLNKTQIENDLNNGITEEFTTKLMNNFKIFKTNGNKKIIPEM